jgi:hypothetical protein
MALLHVELTEHAGESGLARRAMPWNHAGPWPTDLPPWVRWSSAEELDYWNRFNLRHGHAAGCDEEARPPAWMDPRVAPPWPVEDGLGADILVRAEEMVDLGLADARVAYVDGNTTAIYLTRRPEADQLEREIIEWRHLLRRLKNGWATEEETARLLELRERMWRGTERTRLIVSMNEVTVQRRIDALRRERSGT